MQAPGPSPRSAAPWRWGHRYRLEALGKVLGVGEPSLDPLVAQITRHLD